MVEYAYNAWGKPLYTSGSLASTLGVLNPFRYRGYIYDEETGFYYLRSRYYYPNRGRFINADAMIQGNLFSYCVNSPIKHSDTDGFKCSVCDCEHYSLAGNVGDPMKHVLQRSKNDRMEICQFLHFIKQMVDEEWTYAPKEDGGIWYGHVDCVGVYRFTMNWYYNHDTYKELSMDQTDVTDMYYSGTYKNNFRGAKGRGEINDTTEYTVGMALFRLEDTGEDRLHGQHVAYYVGDYFPGYTNAVIEAVESGVIIRSLDESIDMGGPYTHFAYLKGINYPK